MSCFVVVDSARDIPDSEEWKDAVKFNAKDRIVGKGGKRISADYYGNRYRLIAKKECAYTRIYRIERGIIAVVLTVCTLGAALLFKPVRNLLTKDAEKIRIAVPMPSLAEKALQEDIEISPETIAKIQGCMNIILDGREENGVKQYDSQSSHHVFSLESVPEFIFKMQSPYVPPYKDCAMKSRFEKMIRAKKVCLKHNLGLLVIPNARLIHLKVESRSYELLVERKLDFSASKSAQERLYDEHASSLEETIRQLAIFICKTGYSDVELRNNPVLSDAPNPLGQRKIGLIDLEDMEGAEMGLFGIGYRISTGLVGCVNEEQGRMIERVAKQNKVPTVQFKSASRRRKAEIAEKIRLQQYYSAHNIVRGDEPLNVDVNTLTGLNLDEEAEVNVFAGVENGELAFESKKVTMRSVAEAVITAINEELAHNQELDSVKEKRHVLLRTHDPLFSQYNELGLPKDKFIITKEEEKRGWLRQIISALVEKGALFKLLAVNGHGYFIQA